MKFKNIELEDPVDIRIDLPNDYGTVRIVKRQKNSKEIEIEVKSIQNKIILNAYFQDANYSCPIDILQFTIKDKKSS